MTYKGATTDAAEFTINPLDISTSDAITWTTATRYYNGQPQTTTVTGKFGNTPLAENTDFTVTCESQTGSVSGDNQYDVTVTGAGNFTGMKTLKWTITKPSGEIAADQISEKLADGQKATGSYDNSKKTLTVTDSTNIAYVAENTWAVGLTLGLPADTYTAGNVVSSGAGTVEKTTSSGYVTALNWTIQFTKTDVEEAVAAEKTALTYNQQITVYGTPGIAPTTYNIVVPLQGIVLWDSQGRQMYPPHSHNWVLKSNADGVLTVRCDTQDQCPQGGEMSLHLSPVGGTDTRVYNGETLTATLDATEVADFTTHVGATVGAVSYRVKGGAALSGEPKDAGTYEAVVSVSFGGNDYELVKQLTINTYAFTDSHVTLSPTEWPYSGETRSVTVQVTGVTEVTKDVDYTVTGDLSGVGSLTQDTEYTVTVTGKGNFSGTVNKKWTVKAPSGTIADASGAEARGEGQTADACTLSGKTLTVTASKNLCVLGSDDAGYQWYVGFSVALNEGGRAVDPARVRATFSVLGATEYLGSDLDGDVGASNEDITLADGAITWFTRIKLEDVLAAKEDLTFTMTVWQLADENGANSIKPTTYTTVVPLENLVLNDAKGRQCYPVHNHVWEVSTVDGQLTATCNVEGCPQKTKTLTLLGDAARTYNRNAQTFAIDGTEKEQFVIHTGWTVSDVAYRPVGGDVLGAPPADAGDYEAFVTVTEKNGTTTHELKKAFTINPATVDSLTISPTSQVFDGNNKSVTLTVKAGSLTLSASEYDIEGSISGVKGVAYQETTYPVTVKGKGNFTGSANGSWKVTLPTGDAFTGSMTTGTAGCSVSGNNVVISDSKQLSYANGKWSVKMTVTMPVSTTDGSGGMLDWTFGKATYFKGDTTFVSTGLNAYTGTQVLDSGTSTPGLTATTDQKTYRFAYSDIKGRQYRTITYFKDVTYTVDLTLDMLRNATSGTLEFPLTVWASAWSYTESDYDERGPAIQATTYKIVVNINDNLQLLGADGNILYDGKYRPEGVHPYVAQKGATKYDTLAEALTAASAGETVSLIASNAVEAAYTVKPGVALTLADLGNTNSTYVLQANTDHSASLTSVSSNEVVTTDAAGREVKVSEITGGYKYELITVHYHDWSFAVNGNTLTATCHADDCTVPGKTATVVINATDTTWTGSAIGATVTDGFAVSTVKLDYTKVGPNYWQIDRDGNTNSVSSTPKDVGSYIARLTVTVTTNEVQTAYTIEKAYKILRPESYDSGYELAETGVRYDSYGAALSAARNGDTIFCWPAGGTIDQSTHDYSSDKNITVNLLGKTLKYTNTSRMTVKNTGKGVVTLVYGTIQQPGDSWLGSNHDTYFNGGTAGGKLVLGALISVTKYTDASVYSSQIEGNVEFGGQMVGDTYTGGEYRGSLNVNDGATLTITGGKFNTLIDPTSYVPDRGDKYVVREVSSGWYTTEVVAHTHVWTKTASGNVLTVKCEGTDSDLCNYNGEATVTVNAENDTYTGDGYTYAKASVSKAGTLHSTIDPSIVYYVKGGAALSGAPTTCGNYTATITFEGVTASKDFTVYHAPHHYAYTADAEAGTITATCDAEGPCGEGQKAYVATLTAGDKVYDGTAYAATVAKDDGYPTEVTLVYSNDVEEIDAPTAVGSYKVVMTAGGESVEKAFAITRKPIAVPTATALTYTGAEQTGVAATEGCTVTGNTATGAGSYHATATLDDKANFKWVDTDDDTADKTIDWSIAKAVYDMKGVGIGGKTVTYNGAVQTLAVTGDVPAGVEVSYQGNENRNAGTHTVTAQFTGDADNYELIADQQATLTIEPLAITVTPNAGQVKTQGEAYTITYTSEPALVGTDAFTGALEATDEVGEQTITQGTLAISDDNEGKNYALTFTAGVTITVKAATVEFTVAAPDNASVTKVATNGVELVSPYAVVTGTTVTVSYKANEGYLFSNGTDKMDAEITVTEAGEQPAPQGTETTEGKAKIGGVYYLTLAKAIEAYDGTGTIELCADGAVSGEIAKVINLDLAGFGLAVATTDAKANITITNSKATGGVQLAKGGTLTVFDGATVDMSALAENTAGGEGSVYVQDGATLKYPKGSAKLSPGWLYYVYPNMVGGAKGATIVTDKAYVKTLDKTADGEEFWQAEDDVAMAKVTTKSHEPAFDYIEGFTNLATAASWVKAGETVTLLKNIELDAPISVGKKMTLDIGAYDVTPKSTFAGTDTLFVVNYGGDFTVVGTTGTIDASSKSSVYSAIKMTGKDEVFGTNRAKLTVNANVKGYYYGITGNGSRPGTDIVVNGGTVTAVAANDNLAIFNPQCDSTVTVNGGTLTGYLSAIEMRGGTLTVTGGTLTATATEYAVAASGSGTTTKGAAVAIAQHTTKGDISVTITNATLTGVKAVSVANPQGNEADNVAVTLKAATYAGDLAFSADGNATVINDNAEIAAPAGYRWNKSGKLVPDVKVAEVDGVPYADLGDALKATSAGKTCVLLCDVDLADETWTPISGFGGTFDGKGYTISGLTVSGAGEVGFFKSINGGTVKDLTISNATVTATGNKSGILAAVAGPCTVTGVKIVDSSVSSTGEYVGALYGHGYAAASDCEIAGCTISGSEQVGGAIGYMWVGSIENCTVTNNAVTATSRAGGLIGKVQFAGQNIGIDPSDKMWINGNTVGGTVDGGDTAGGIAGQIMGDDTRYEIKDNTVDVALTGTAKNPVGVLRDGQNEAFTGTLAAKITGNWWEDQTLAADSYQYTNVASGVDHQTIYRGVAQIGTATYKTLAAAFDAAEAGDAIKVLVDCAVAERINIDPTKDITLDANAKTITIATNIYAFVNGGAAATTGTGTFTVTGDGTFYAPTANGTCFLWARYGNIVVESGSFSMDGSAQCVYADNGCKATINGGTFVNRTGNDVLNVHNSRSAVTDIQVSGGSYSRDPALGDDALGGTFVASGYASYKDGELWTVSAAMPKATVAENPLAAALGGLDAAYTFTTNGVCPAQPVASKNVDYVVTFDKDVEAGAIRLAAVMEDGWTNFPAMKFTAGKQYPLIASMQKTVSVVEMYAMGSFTCGISNISVKTETKMTVQLVMADTVPYVITNVTYTITAKGPTVIDPIGGDPEETPEIKPVEGTNGVYYIEVKTNTTTAVEIAGLKEDDTVIVPPQINAVNGTESSPISSNQVKVVANATNGTETVVVDITPAFTIKEEDNGVLIELNSNAVVTVKIEGKDPEAIPVVPELTESEDPVKPLVIDETKIATGVKTIPGLKYSLLSGDTVTKIDTVVKTIVAEDTRVVLEAAKTADPSKFYKIQVAK